MAKKKHQPCETCGSTMDEYLIEVPAGLGFPCSKTKWVCLNCAKTRYKLIESLDRECKE